MGGPMITFTLLVLATVMVFGLAWHK